MNLEDWRKSKEYSHYQSLIKQDIENKKRIKQLIVENTELKRKQANRVDKSESTCNLQSVTHSALLEASKAIVSNIETWLDTGDPADSKTSKMLYDNLKKAIVDVEHCG